MNASGLTVVDANVYVKLYTAEPLRAQAEALFAGEATLIAPDFMGVEAASVFLKKIRRGEYPRHRVQEPLDRLPDLVQSVRCIGLSTAAFEIAATYGRSAYDSLYVALALQMGCRLVTADEKLVNALRLRFPDTMVWLGDLPLS